MIKQIPKDKLKTCHYCYFRHCCPYPIQYEGCKHWRIGKCLLCKHLNASDDEWFKRGCETCCLGGCREHFKRDWKATFRWWFKRIVKDEV